MVLGVQGHLEGHRVGGNASLAGMFVAYHGDGRLRAVVCIHVDDTRYAGDESSKVIFTGSA